MSYSARLSTVHVFIVQIGQTLQQAIAQSNHLRPAQPIRFQIIVQRARWMVLSNQPELVRRKNIKRGHRS